MISAVLQAGFSLTKLLSLDMLSKSMTQISKNLFTFKPR